MTATPDMVINAYSDTLRHGDLDSTIMTHVTGTKFVNGNGEISDHCPLNWMLLECFDTDAHFVQYTCPKAVRCIKSDKYELSFKFCRPVDLDFKRHGARPTRLDFSDLCRRCYVIGVEDHLTPSILYETRGGARAIWLIEEIRDAEEFERHYAALLAKLDAIFCHGEDGYRIDTAVRDWTRLYRCPLVERDGCKEYMRLVRLFHTDTIDLRTFRPKKKPERKVMRGDMPYDAGDMYLLRTLSEIIEGSRNQAVFKAICHINRKYGTAAAEKWLNTIHTKAINSGLDDREFESILRSAQNQMDIT